jgi:uncharacterized protein (TIRG00374 family)
VKQVEDVRRPVSETTAVHGPAISLVRQLLSWRTLVPLAIAVVGLAVALPNLARGFSPEKVGAALAHANPSLLLLGLLSFYASFALRTVRWRVLLENIGAGEDRPLRLPPLRRLTEILYLSWYANVLVPAKLGDFYRAHLLKEDTGLPMSRTYGTVLAERALDLTMLLALFSLAAVVSVPATMPPQLTLALRTVAVVALLLIAGLLSLRSFGAKLVRWLPARVQGIYTHFLEGTVGAFRRLPLLVGYGVAIWALEVGRFFGVAEGVGVLRGDALHVVGAAVVVALAQALLTAVPFTSGGIGFVEAGMLLLLQLLEPGVGDLANLAAATILLDRLLGLGSILLFGTILLLIVTLRGARSRRRQVSGEVG